MDASLDLFLFLTTQLGSNTLALWQSEKIDRTRFLFRGSSCGLSGLTDSRVTCGGFRADVCFLF